MSLCHGCKINLGFKTKNTNSQEKNQLYYKSYITENTVLTTKWAKVRVPTYYRM